MSPPNVSKSPVDAPSPSVPASALPVARGVTGAFSETALVAAVCLVLLGVFTVLARYSHG